MLGISEIKIPLSRFRELDFNPSPCYLRDLIKDEHCLASCDKCDVITQDTIYEELDKWA